MAEKPILFNTEMVRAILDGRKTQTRRLVKPAYKGELYPIWKFPDRLIPEKTANDEWMQLWLDEVGNPYTCVKVPCKGGDILWVRESWAKVPGSPPYIYRATYSAGEMKWRPSIHMPKEAARLFLRVTGIRCERLQDITAMDAFNEGTGRLFLDDIAYGDKDYGCDIDDKYGLAREQFAWLWDSTVKKADLPRYGWEANPWVWVIEFERCEKP